MNILSIIEKKKRKEQLNSDEINYFIGNYTNGKIPDYQIASLLMAIRLNGMNIEETTLLTQAMMLSGDVLTYESVDKIIVDKHSTGGVGDKTSLVIVPLLATLGYGVSKMSGRGLGFTGGTIDKLEALEGFKTDISEEDLQEQVRNIGCVVVSQNEKLVPADKLLYALRDVTATVDSVSLISSSIMSKKLALGADVIVLDVKYGNGSFMKTFDEAQELAQTMRAIGEKVGKKVIAFITSMQQPLGNNIGNSLEVEEAIFTMKNEGNQELKDLCVNIAVEVLMETQDIKFDEALEIVNNKFKTLEVFEKFKEMIIAQGASEVSIENMPKAKCVYNFSIDKSGYVKEIEANKIGEAAMLLGAGRLTKEDAIDLSVGFKLKKKVGDKVDLGDVLIEIYYNDELKLKDSLKVLKEAYNIVDYEVEELKIVEEIIKGAK